ncbi:hypothetical protein H5410_047344 [Solanum commersonii]|uniref:Secreted protein n=1 Tax=Solanum commersonii TaxID=4109 RepID=A0A9J5XID6_SOLCO|nr:hypothetical protein H5410_047344 [Solanum commersonii]
MRQPNISTACLAISTLAIHSSLTVTSMASSPSSSRTLVVLRLRLLRWQGETFGSRPSSVIGDGNLRRNVGGFSAGTSIDPSLKTTVFQYNICFTKA